MNIVFYFIVILIAILLWALLGFVFIPLGKFLYKLIKDPVDIMMQDSEDNKDSKDNKDNENK